MIRISTLFFIPFLLFYPAIGQDGDSMKRLFEFASQTENYLEGYGKNLGENEFQYHSFRADVSRCLIARCTDGNTNISWETQSLPSTLKGNGAGFLWMTAMDLSSDAQKFELWIDNRKHFEWHSSLRDHWTIQNHEGSILRFEGVEKDQHGDAHGYMSLWISTHRLVPGKPLHLEIKGEAALRNTWILVYQATDAAAFFHNSIRKNGWIEIRFMEGEEGISAGIRASRLLAGKFLNYSMGELSGNLTLTGNEGYASGKLELPSPGKDQSFVIKDDYDAIFVTPSTSWTGSQTKLLRESLLKINSERTGQAEITMEARRDYYPNTVSALKKLAESNVAGGKVMLMNSSHQDIAWMDSPEKCILERDTMLLTPLLDKAQSDPGYRFDVEDALMLREYLHRHPDKRDLVKQLLDDGRLTCGSTYIQPYEEMYSGESLVRQFYLGAKWLKDELGYTSDTYWNVDVPGRTWQMPQMLYKAGSVNMVVSRMNKGMYKWYSPDGSFVYAYSPGHYSDAFTPLARNFPDAAQFIATQSLDWAAYYSTHPVQPVIPILSDWDMSPAKDYGHHIRDWESVDEMMSPAEKNVEISLPRFQIASTPEFFEAWKKGTDQFKELRGERPAVWLYIHGPSHQEAIKASREGDIMLTMAEKFAVANALAKGTFKDYPYHDLREAWEHKIYPDHGWGGKNGDITDALFLQKFQLARNRAEVVLQEEIKEIASQIGFDRKKGIPMVVFNSLSWNRTDPVKFQIRFDPGKMAGLKLIDSQKNEIPVQISSHDLYPDGTIKDAEVCFIAENVPSVGYKTFYLQPGPAVANNLPKDQSNSYENKYYRLEFGKGGIRHLFDKELNTDIIDPSVFEAGEIFTMRSIGNGAGEFTDVQQPDMEGFDKTGDRETEWDLIASGPVFTAYDMRQPVKYATVEQTLIIYNQIKRIDIEVSILNWEGVLYREFRMAMPLNMKNGEVSYEVPFGKVTVGRDEISGAAGERYITECSKIHPRGIENWIGSTGNGFGFTMSSSVAVADWVDPTASAREQIILQPILFASRKSCHGEGNEYLQTGDHHFSFSITSHRPGWIHGYRFGKQANEKLQAVVDPVNYIYRPLPENLSFFGSGNSNIIISSAKKAEDEDALILRFYEMEGEDGETELTLFKPFRQAFSTNLIEEPLRELGMDRNKLKIKTGHHAIETILIR